MNNFNFYSPTHYYFGKGKEEETGAAVKLAGGSKVLIHYGGRCRLPATCRPDSRVYCHRRVPRISSGIGDSRQYRWCPKASTAPQDPGTSRTDTIIKTIIFII